jgi:hypothetical protein
LLDGSGRASRQPAASRHRWPPDWAAARRCKCSRSGHRSRRSRTSTHQFWRDDGARMSFSTISLTCVSSARQHDVVAGWTWHWRSRAFRRPCGARQRQPGEYFSTTTQIGFKVSSARSFSPSGSTTVGWLGRITAPIPPTSVRRPLQVLQKPAIGRLPSSQLYRCHRSDLSSCLPGSCCRRKSRHLRL